MFGRNLLEKRAVGASFKRMCSNDMLIGFDVLLMHI